MSMFAQLDDQEEVPGYAPVCGLAVLGFVLSLLSGLAWLSPVMWTIPVLGVLVSVVSLRRIASQSPRLGGRKLAAWGLCLSLLAGGGAVAYEEGAKALTIAQGRHIAASWFDYLRRGEVERSHQLMLEPAERESRVNEIKDIYAESELRQEQLKAYLNTEPIGDLAREGDKAKVELKPLSDLYTTAMEEMVIDVYTVTIERDGKPQSQDYRVTVVRRVDARGKPLEWKIGSVGMEAPPTPPKG
ncbi:MAG: hypothetical protein HYS13_05275 [Planctomycetia bacterium]|nr:hypothetical protein [Planctomycetia bacterium]